MLILSSHTLQVPPESWFGVALLVLAIVLLVVDLHVTNHGLPTVGGLVALAIGVLMLFATTASYLRVLLVALAAVAILLGVIFVGALREVRAAKEWPVLTGVEGMIGEVGVAKEPIGTRTPGWVFVHGEWWRAILAIAPEDDANKQARQEVIGTGRRVLVVGLQDGIVAVVRFEPAALEHSKS